MATRVLMVLRKFIALAVFWPALVSAKPACVPIDLRDLLVAPPLPQTYVDESGTVHDSGWCYAFALAQAAGQVLERPVSPADIALNHNACLFPNGRAEELLKKFGGVADAHARVNQAGGYLAVSSAVHAPNWFGELAANARGKSADEFVKAFAGRRLKLPAQMSFRSFAIAMDYPGDLISPEQAADLIDRTLEAGRFALISARKAAPDGRVFSHAVTVVGRTSNCDYLVQDSIPASHYEPLGWPSFHDGVMEEHLQLWRRETLTAHISALRYFEESECAAALKPAASIRVRGS